MEPDLSTILDPNAPDPALAGQPAYAQMQQPVPDMQEMVKPPESPEDLDRRKSAWTSFMAKLQEPNVRRAISIAGAYMAQPRPMGQSTAGHLAAAMMTGTSAYGMGEQAAFERAKTEAESGAKVAGEQARTAEVVQRTETERQTQASTVAKAKTDADLSQFNLDKAKSEEDVVKVERELRKRKADATKDVTDAKLKASIEAEYDTPIARVEALRAEAKQHAATGREKAAKASVEELTAKIIKDMSPQEQKDYLTKTGRYATHTSGISQQAQMWGEIYDKLPDKDIHKTGKTREQFQMEQLQSSKAKDVGDFLTRYMAAGGDDPDIIQGISDIIKYNLSARKPPAAENASIEWQKAPGGKEFRTLPNGKIEWRRTPAAPVSPMGAGSSNMP